MQENVATPGVWQGRQQHSAVMPALRLLVFTDLDGTLLDHDDYSFAAARPVLYQLRQLHIPLVAVTSKTLAEVAVLQRALHNRHPCIVENGSAICIPRGYFDNKQIDDGDDEYQVIRLSPDYRCVIEVLQQLRERHGYDFRGFHDMSAEQVADDTGLTRADAARARMRLCSEPLLWEDSAAALTQFTAALETHGLQLTRGGRYWHVLGGSDKAVAMTALIEMYRDHGYPPCTTLALGDSANDESMLNAADIAVTIRRKDGGVLNMPTHERLVVSNLPGPRGWNAAMQQLLTTFGPLPADGQTLKENAHV